MIGAIVRGVGIALLVVVGIAGIAAAGLRFTAPSPRDAAGWTLGPPLPAPRGELATAVGLDAPCPQPTCPGVERLYVLGGLGGLASALRTVDSLGSAERQWRAEPALPAPRHHLAAAGLGTAVYVSGGTADLGQPWSPTDDFWRLEAGAEGWQALTPMPEPRWGHRLVAHDGRLFVIGGHGPSSRVLIWSPEDGWAAGAAMPAPRHHLSAVAAGGRIWAIGGRAGTSMARVDIYDAAADRWQPGPELPAPTSGAGEGVVGDLILVFGGEEQALFGGGVFDRHWMLDPAAGAPAWQPAPMPPLAVHGADGAVFQGTMVIVGGASRHGLLSVTAWTDAFQRLDPAVFED